MAETPMGRSCGHELMTPAKGPAQEFYTRLTGWGTSVWEGEAGPYTMWMNGEMPIGGVMELTGEAAEQGAVPCWLAYISTPDLDATLAKTTQLGGQVLHQMAIKEVGRFAVLADPQGGVFAVLEPEGDTPGHDCFPEVGEFSWHELSTTDWEAAWAFYSEVFGWQETSRMEMPDGGIYQMFGRTEHPAGGIYNKHNENMPAGWLLYIRVSDAEAAAKAVEETGGKVLNGPMEVPGGDTIAQCLDPQGVPVALHSVAAKKEEPDC